MFQKSRRPAPQVPQACVQAHEDTIVRQDYQGHRVPRGAQIQEQRVNAVAPSPNKPHLLSIPRIIHEKGDTGKEGFDSLETCLLLLILAMALHQVSERGNLRKS